jgi:hypothetical protein
MKIHIELEDNIVKPCKKTSFLNSETKKTLQSMEKGQSFIVKKSGQVQHIQVYGRSVGKRFSSRKIYTGERQDKNFHFRVWLEGDREPITRKPDYAKNQPKTFGSLSKKASESDGEGSATERSKVPNDILSLVELREENRMIVDDLNKIKKILRQELGYSDFSLEKTDFMEDDS